MSLHDAYEGTKHGYTRRSAHQIHSLDLVRHVATRVLDERRTASVRRHLQEEEAGKGDDEDMLVDDGGKAFICGQDMVR